MRRFTKWALLALVLLLTFATFAVAQEPPPEPVEPTPLAEFIGLLFSSGLTVAVVQLLRRMKIVDLVPGFLRPVIAAAIGLGAVALSNALGITVDLSAIASLFAAGGGATLLFGIGKEAGVLNHSR